jgi:hypothetical protein
MANEEVPTQTGVFRYLGIERRDGVVDVCALVVTSFDQKRLVTSEGETGSERLQYKVSW